MEAAQPRVYPDGLSQAVRFACWMAALKLVFHIATNIWQAHLGYGLHRDELYYLICGRRLAWGYVDQAPLVALQSHIAILLFGKSLAGIRLLSALAGAGRVFLTGILCWQLGGQRTAQFLAMLGVLVGPQFQSLDSFLSMNSFEPLFWLSFLIILIALTRSATPKYWLLAGAIAGVGLLNKPSMLFFIFTAIAALLLTPQRKILNTRYLPTATILAILIALPYVLWQYHHDWATWRYLRIEHQSNKYLQFDLFNFMQAPERAFMPITFPIWVAGIYWLLHDRPRRNIRWLGYTFLLFFFLMAALQAKDYYLAPIYSLLFAAGGIFWETLLQQRYLIGWRTAALWIFSLAAITHSLILLPMTIPVVTPAYWPRYLDLTGQRVGRVENFSIALLPQFYADRFGWSELAAEIKRIVATLPPQERAHLGILCDNFGEASAINFFDTRAETPLAISGHNNYYLWGPNGYTGDELLLVTDKTPGELRKTYASVEAVGHMQHPLAMPYETKTIYLVHGRIRPLQDDWPSYQWYY